MSSRSRTNAERQAGREAMIEALGEFRIFQSLEPEELDAIAKLCKTAQVKRGEQIFQAGEPARSLFLVWTGKIELRFKVVYSNAAVEIPLDSKAAGEFFGWSALIPPYRYTLSAYVVEESELLRIDQADIQRSCEANTHLGYKLMKNIAQVIGQRFQIAEQMLVKEVQDGLRHKDPLA